MTLTLNAVGGGPVVVPPGAVTGLTASARFSAAHLAWTAPGATGTPVTSYTITATSGGMTRSYTVAASQTSLDIGQLVNGVTWTVAVVPVSSAGPAPSATTTVTPTTASAQPTSPVQPTAHVPGAPVLTDVGAGAGGADVWWSAPLDNGGANITSYRVTATGAGVPVVTATAPATATTLTLALRNDVAYSVTVAAVNVAGTGAPSNALTVTPTADNPDVTPPTPPVPPKVPVVPPPVQPVLDAFPVTFPLDPAFFLKSPDEAADILAARIGTGS